MRNRDEDRLTVDTLDLGDSSNVSSAECESRFGEQKEDDESEDERKRFDRGHGRKSGRAIVKKKLWSIGSQKASLWRKELCGQQNDSGVTQLERNWDGVGG